MAIQQQINHGTIQKVCYLHNGIFIPFTCDTLSNLLFRVPYLIH